MIASQVILQADGGGRGEIELQLIAEAGLFKSIVMVVRLPAGIGDIDALHTTMVRLNRGTGLAIANILSGWASELPVSP